MLCFLSSLSYFFGEAFEIVLVGGSLRTPKKGMCALFSFADAFLGDLKNSGLELQVAIIVNGKENKKVHIREKSQTYNK